LLIASKVVELQVADGEKMIWALGAELTNWPPPTEIVELAKVMVAPVLGTPFAVKLALNQTHWPGSRGVPLKFDAIVDCAALLDGGGVPQVILVGEKLIPTVFAPTSAAVPEKLTVPPNAGNGPQTEPLYVVELAVKGSKRVIGEPPGGGEMSIVYSIRYFVPGTSPDALT
jgi:hypothetical protein